MYKTNFVFSSEHFLSIVQANASYFLATYAPVKHPGIISLSTGHVTRIGKTDMAQPPPPPTISKRDTVRLPHSLQCNGVPTGPRLTIPNQVTSFSAGL